MLGYRSRIWPSMSSKYVVKLTLAEAESLGIVKCRHCGWPRNNHFDFTYNGRKMPCAHDKDCPGYQAKFVVGKAIKRAPRVLPSSPR